MRVIPQIEVQELKLEPWVTTNQCVVGQVYEYIGSGNNKKSAGANVLAVNLRLCVGGVVIGTPRLVSLKTGQGHHSVPDAVYKHRPDVQLTCTGE